MKIVVGLGNPGEEYVRTRHNVGRIVLERFRKKYDFETWKFDKRLNAHISEGVLGKTKVLLVTPDTFMNNSGTTIKKIVTSKKGAGDVLVVYDDLDIPFGSKKISFGRSSGGHNGLESVIRALGTKDFPRLRIGVSPSTPAGKLRKPLGEKKVMDFLLGNFSKKEEESFSKIFKQAGEVIEKVVTEGYVPAMNMHN